MFHPVFKKFLFHFGIYTLAIWIVSFALYHWFPALHLNKWYPFVLLFLFLVAVVSFYFTSKSAKGKLSNFANVYMLLNFVRLVLFSVVIFVYAYLHKNDAASFTLTFFAYYLLLTVWEVVALRKIKS